jgi:hypothetical protein
MFMMSATPATRMAIGTHVIAERFVYPNCNRDDGHGVPGFDFVPPQVEAEFARVEQQDVLQQVLQLFTRVFHSAAAA